MRATRPDCPLPPDRAHALARILARAVVKAIEQEGAATPARDTAPTVQCTGHAPRQVTPR